MNESEIKRAYHRSYYARNKAKRKKINERYWSKKVSQNIEIEAEFDTKRTSEDIEHKPIVSLLLE